MPAQIASPQPKSLYKYVGKNLAPKRALDELSHQRPVRNPDSLTKALQKKYQDLMSRDEDVWNEKYLEGKKVANARMGKLLQLRNVYTGQIMFVKRDSKYADNKTVGGLFQFYSTKLTAEWLSSNPEIDPIVPSNDDQIEEFMSAVKIVQDHYSQKFYTVDYVTDESLSAQDYGTWVTRYRFDPEKGDIVCELLDFPACRWDIRFKAYDSSYFLYESKCSNAVLEKLLDAEIAPDSEDRIENYGLQIIEQIAKQGGNIRGLGKDRQTGAYNNVPGENVVTEMWLQPEQYCDIDLEASEPTLGGVTLPKGESLLKVFPNGMCVVGINGMNTIIGLYAEDHRDHIVVGLYHTQPFSGVGKGITDAVDVKKEIDRFYSQRSAYVEAHATPATYYNQDLITEEQARNIGKPRKAIPVDFKNAPDGVTSITQAVQAIVPQNPGDGIWRTDEQLRQDLQMSFQVTDFSNGLPGVDNTTATGAKIGDANAETLLVPQHLNKALQRMQSAKVIYNLFKKFVDKPKWFATKDKNGITAGKYISGTQFDGVDIDFQIVANSEVPQTPFQQRDALSQMMQFTGGVTGIIEGAAANPDIMNEVATAFGAKLSIPKRDDIARICRKRVEQAREILETELQNQQVMAMVAQATGMSDLMPDNADLPQVIVSQLMPPISPLEPYSQQKAAWLGELLDNDEMQYTPVEMRYVIEAMIRTQLGLAVLGQAQIEQTQNLGGVIAQMPQLLGEQAMNTQNQQLAQEYQMQQAQAQMQQQLQLKAAEAEIGETQAEASQKRSEASDATAHARAKELKAMDMQMKQAA